MLYIKEDIISSSTYYFCTGKSVSKDMENIKDIIDDSVTFKEEVGRNETISNKIQTIISLCKDNLEAVIEKKIIFQVKENLIIGWAMMDSKKINEP